MKQVKNATDDTMHGMSMHGRKGHHWAYVEKLISSKGDQPHAALVIKCTRAACAHAHRV